MAIFSLIFFKIISVLLSVIVGFIAGKIKKIDNGNILDLLFYFISPIIFFSAPSNISFGFTEISVVIVTFTISSILCLSSYWWLRFYWVDNTRNILAFSAGNGNCGYFMLPIVITIFNDYTLSLYMMAIIGIVLYEASIGFYICTYSTHSPKESIKQIIKLPVLNAFILGCIMSISGLTLPDFLDDFIDSMRSVYSILGMMTIGLGLSSLKTFKIDIKFSVIAVFIKYIIFPLLVYILVLVDKFILHLYNKEVHHALQMISLSPLAGNILVMSSLTKFSVEKAATAILISALLALIYIPLMISLFFSDLL